MDILTARAPSALLPDVIRIAEQASGAIRQVYDSDFAVSRKDDDSPLTAADLAAHETICRGLLALTPGVPILSEESSGLPWQERRGWQTYWLVDPLDGTREFIKRNGEFTVNIALIHRNEAVLGVVHVPITQVCYYAAAGHGAWRSEAGTVPQRIHTRRTDRGHIITAGSRSHGSKLQQRFFESLGPDTETIVIGSSLKFCLVAEGQIDIYPRFGPTSEWDSAAAQCVVEQAGGLVTDLQLQPIRYNTKESLLNPDFLVIADPRFDWKSLLDKVT